MIFILISVRQMHKAGLKYITRIVVTNLIVELGKLNV